MLKKARIYSLILASVSGIAYAGTASAQQVPSSADPGVTIRNLGEERRQPSTIEQSVTLGDEQVSDKGASTKKVFTLKSVVVDGNTVYNDKAIAALLPEYLGKPVSFADLNAIARVLTRKYRADGYMFSRVILPPQEIDGGVVHLQAIEGRLTEVEVVGNYKDNNGLIKSFAEKIKSAGPSNSAQLERYLLLIDDLPGIKARSLLQPSQTPGGGKLIITVEQDTFEGSAGIDNRGSKYLGRARGTLVGAFNSLFGIHDRTTLRGIMTQETEEMKFADITHEEQVGTEGLRLKGRFAVTKTNPGGDLEDLDVEGDSRLLDLEALYPMIRSRQYNLNLIGGFTGLNSQSDILGLDVSEDRVRYLRGGGSFDFTDSLAGVTQIDLELAKGVDLFNATEDGTGRSRENGEHDFFRTNLHATRIQHLWGDFSAQISGAGQYSPDALLASEEFSIGGAEFGRAYDSGEITGDRGLAGSLELRYGGPVDQNDFLKSYQVYGYYDAGKVWNKDVGVGETAQASLASAGVGVRFNLAYDFSGYVEFNKPLTRDVSAEGDDDSRLFFNVLKRF